MALPPAYTPNESGYLSSKVAQVKVMEFLAAEHPEKFVCSIHPGLHNTKIFRASKASPDTLPMDTGKQLVHPMTKPQQLIRVIHR